MGILLQSELCCPVQTKLAVLPQGQEHWRTDRICKESAVCQERPFSSSQFMPTGTGYGTLVHVSSPQDQAPSLMLVLWPSRVGWPAARYQSSPVGTTSDWHQSLVFAVQLKGPSAGVCRGLINSRCRHGTSDSSCSHQEVGFQDPLVRRGRKCHL
jgi:hypothetical protein